MEAAGIPKAIATSSCRELADACLTPFDLRGDSAFVLTSEDIVRGKPDPEVYLAAAARFGVQPAEMLVLEDSQNGCRAAAAAGAFTVAVPGEHSRQQDFSVASLVVGSLADARLYAALGIPARRLSDRKKTRLDARSKKALFSPPHEPNGASHKRRPGRLGKEKHRSTWMGPHLGISRRRDSCGPRSVWPLAWKQVARFGHTVRRRGGPSRSPAVDERPIAPGKV